MYNKLKNQKPSSWEFRTEKEHGFSVCCPKHMYLIFYKTENPGKKTPTMFGKSTTGHLWQQFFNSKSPEWVPSPEPPQMKPPPQQMHPKATVTAPSAFCRHQNEYKNNPSWN